MTPPRIPRARAVVLVVLGLVIAGALSGVLWAWLAPPVHGVVALSKSGERAHAYLGNESDHFFVAAVMMLGILTVLTVTAAVLVWQWRPHRGPLMVGALTIGSLAGAAVAAAVGTALAGMCYPAVDFDAAPVTPERRVHYFVQAPSVFFGHTPVQAAVGLVVPVAVGALVCALLAVSAERDDLGAYPPEDPPGLPTPTAVTVDGAQPPVR